MIVSVVSTDLGPRLQLLEAGYGTAAAGGHPAAIQLEGLLTWIHSGHSPRTVGVRI
jgi:hypothetical protein